LRVQSASGPAVTTITTTITVAAESFAPGHLGELTRIVPFELADGVLADAGAVQRRLWLLPSRAGVYFVLALGLFAQVSYLGVAPPAPRLRPPGQIPAITLEQPPGRQTPHLPANHQDHHRGPRRAPANSDTPPAVRDNRQRPLTPRYCA
jgi:hypothetical protein